MTTQTIKEFAVLHDGYAVPKAFYDMIRQRVEEAVPGMIRGEIYELMTLFGEGWDLLSRGDRRTAGRIMVSMVKMKLLPLVIAKTRHEYSVRYKRTEDPVD